MSAASRQVNLWSPGMAYTFVTSQKSAAVLQPGFNCSSKAVPMPSNSSSYISEVIAAYSQLRLIHRGKGFPLIDELCEIEPCVEYNLTELLKLHGMRRKGDERSEDACLRLVKKLLCEGLDGIQESDVQFEVNKVKMEYFKQMNALSI